MSIDYTSALSLHIQSITHCKCEMFPATKEFDDAIIAAGKTEWYTVSEYV